MNKMLIFAVMATAGTLVGGISIATPTFAAPHGGGGMHSGGAHFGGGGTHFGGGGTHFGGGGFRGRGFGPGFALGGLGLGLGYPYYAYGSDPYYDDGYYDCYAPRRVWWHGAWQWRRVYAC